MHYLFSSEKSFSLSSLLLHNISSNFILLRQNFIFILHFIFFSSIIILIQLKVEILFHRHTVDLEATGQGLPVIESAHQCDISVRKAIRHVARRAVFFQLPLSFLLLRLIFRLHLLPAISFSRVIYYPTSSCFLFSFSFSLFS